MNIYVVRKATQGLADYILEQGTDKKRVAIAFDSRHMSPEFADEAARTLAANGIKAFIFESLRPTPEVTLIYVLSASIFTVDGLPSFTVLLFCAQIPTANPYPPDGKKEVGGMTLGLANGAQWNTDENSFVNKLNFNDGIINVNGGEGQEVKLGDINGSGGTVNMLTSSDLKTAK